MKNYLLFILKTSLEDFRRNKGRTFLTSLGILIGVLAVVLLIALGLGLKNYIGNQFNSLGTNLIYVLPGKIISSGGVRSGSGALGGASFDFKDIQNLKRIPEIEFVVPTFTKTAQVEGSLKTQLSDIGASTADLFEVRNLEPEIGRVFDNNDEAKRSKIAVLGPKIADEVFGDKYTALGKTVRVNNQRFTVIGVLKAKGGGGLGGPDFDAFTYMPFESAYSLNPDKKIVAIYIKSKSEADVQIAKAKAEQVLAKRYKQDDFSVVEQTEILSVVDSIFAVLNSILVAIGSISLLVGGIGIMNIMYATVTERIREIGIRRAIGATKRDILLQFLTEAVLLSILGGLLGLVAAGLIVLGIRSFFPASLSPIAAIAALIISTLIGVFFGVFPAKKAADLSPIEAIRYE